MRLSLYVYMSILLEQQFTVNSHVTLRFPKSTTSPVIPSVAGGSLHRASSNSHVIGRPKRESGSGLWAYISKKKDNFFHFAAAGSASLTRRGSIDSPALQKGSSTPSSRTSEDGHSRPRRLSFISDLRTSFMQPHKELEVEPPEEDTPFASTLSHLRKFEDLLSTSPGVRYPLPKILYTLAEREKQNPEYKPTGDERAALSSILGWEGKNDLGKSMAGVKGFVRHQGFVALYSEQVVSSRPPTPTSSQPSASSSTISLSLPQKPSQCGVRKRWAGYRFYNRNGCNIDECLGMTVMRICKKAEDPCEVPECRYKRWEHEMRWIHGGIRITASVRVPKEVDTDEEKEHDPMEMWQSCAICKEESKKELVLDGTL